MSFAGLQKVVTYLLAAFGLVALTFGGELSWSALGLIGAGFVASWFAEGPLLARPLWGRGWTVALVAALVIQVWRGLFMHDGWLGLAMEFAGLLSVSRLSNRRTGADYQQIAMLAFIQLIAATVLTTDLGYAGVFVAFVIATPWVLTLAHLRSEIERNYPSQADEHGGTDLARVLASRRIVGPRFLLWTALLSVPMLAMTVGLFAVFPRVGLGFVSFGSSRGQHVAGFGNKVELGGFGVIRDDPTVVVRVQSQKRLTKAEEVRYLRLRGTAFDQYDGRKWTRSPGESVRMSAMGDYYPLRRMPERGDVTLKIILDRLDEPVLFLPPGTVGLRIPFRSIPGVGGDRMSLARNHGLDLRYQSGEELGIVYDAILSADEEDRDVPVARDTDNDRYLQMPPGHRRVIELAKKLTKDLTDSQQIAQRLESHLRDDDRYVYSVEQPDTGNKPPLEVFLFEARRGHCEYFATALAIMLRSVGIPARNVTGFVGGEYNSYGGYYGVRQADAHSWVEALLPGRGWVTFDPTPPSRDDFGPAQLFRELSDMVDAMRAYWMMRVVAYDLRTQVRALRQLRAFIRELSFPSFDFGGDRDKGGDRSSTNDLSGGSLVVMLALLAGLLLAAFVAVRLLRRSNQQRVLSLSAREAKKLYEQLEQALAQKGRARPSHVTPEAHARSLKAEGFAAADAVAELTDVYVKARYGEMQLPLERMRALKQCIKDVKRAA